MQKIQSTEDYAEEASSRAEEAEANRSELVRAQQSNKQNGRVWSRATSSSCRQVSLSYSE